MRDGMCVRREEKKPKSRNGYAHQPPSRRISQKVVSIIKAKTNASEPPMRGGGVCMGRAVPRDIRRTSPRSHHPLTTPHDVDVDAAPPARLDTQSGGSHLGFPCPRQCLCAASSLDSTAPHSGHTTPERFMLASQDVELCRCWSCRRVNVLPQLYSHGWRLVRPPPPEEEVPPPPLRRYLARRRDRAVKVEAEVEAGEGEGKDAAEVDGEDGKDGAGAATGVGVEPEEEEEEPEPEARGGAGAMARNFLLL